MEKLNELVYRAKGYLRTKSEGQPEQINVSCETILAITEAFRALERQKESAEHERDCHMDIVEHFKENCRELVRRAEAAEAKLSALQEGFVEAIRHKDRLADELNELAKQEPVAWTSQANLDTLKSEQCKTLEFMTGDKSIYSNPVPLYARPSPAIHLAELVLDENDNPEGFISWYERHFAMNTYKGSSHVADCENAWRAAILRNIEESK